MWIDRVQTMLHPVSDNFLSFVSSVDVDIERCIVGPHRRSPCAVFLCFAHRHRHRRRRRRLRRYSRLSLLFRVLFVPFYAFPHSLYSTTFLFSYRTKHILTLLVCASYISLSLCSCYMSHIRCVWFVWLLVVFGFRQFRFQTEYSYICIFPPDIYKTRPKQKSSYVASSHRAKPNAVWP